MKAELRDEASGHSSVSDTDSDSDSTTEVPANNKPCLFKTIRWLSVLMSLTPSFY